MAYFLEISFSAQLIFIDYWWKFFCFSDRLLWRQICLSSDLFIWVSLSYTFAVLTSWLYL